LLLPISAAGAIARKYLAHGPARAGGRGKQPSNEVMKLMIANTWPEPRQVSGDLRKIREWADMTFGGWG